MYQELRQARGDLEKLLEPEDGSGAAPGAADAARLMQVERAECAARAFCSMANIAKSNTPSIWAELAQKIREEDWGRLLAQPEFTTRVFQSLSRLLSRQELPTPGEDLFLDALSKSKPWMAALRESLLFEQGEPVQNRVSGAGGAWLRAQIEAMKGAPKRVQKKFLAHQSRSYARFWGEESTNLRRLADAGAGTTMTLQQKERVFESWKPWPPSNGEAVDETDETLAGCAASFAALAELDLIEPAAARKWANEMATSAPTMGSGGWAAVWAIAEWCLKAQAGPERMEKWRASPEEWALWRDFAEKHPTGRSTPGRKRALACAVLGDEHAQLAKQVAAQKAEAEAAAREQGEGPSSSRDAGAKRL